MRLNFVFTLFFIFYISTSNSQNRNFTIADSLRGTNSFERACFDVSYYDLNVKFDFINKRLSGDVVVYFSILETTSALQFDLDKDLTLESIVDENNQTISFKRVYNSIFLNFLKPLPKGVKSKVTFRYYGSPKVAINPPWDGGIIWKKDSNENPWVTMACEGIGASMWWPCKDIPLDEPDSMQMQFEVPEKLTCISNGNLIAVKPTNDKTNIFSWKVSHPINLYNVTFNIGNYIHLADSMLSISEGTLRLDYYVLQENEQRAKVHFKQVKDILSEYENLFGPYPFIKDGYALVETPYWGMEHQSAISYGNEFKNNLNDRLDYIIVHESGHEWWGNAVTAADHADLWIHESFTTYGESMLLEKRYGKEVAENHLNIQKSKIKNVEPIQGPRGVNYHYWVDSDMYYKGANVLHTLRLALNNDSLWFALFPALQKQFKFKQINTEELIRFMGDFLGKDFSGILHYYLTKTQPPIVEYTIKEVHANKIELQYSFKTGDTPVELSIPFKIDGVGIFWLNLGPTIQVKELPISQKTFENWAQSNTFYIFFKKK